MENESICVALLLDWLDAINSICEELSSNDELYALPIDFY